MKRKLIKHIYHNEANGNACNLYDKTYTIIDQQAECCVIVNHCNGIFSIDFPIFFYYFMVYLFIVVIIILFVLFFYCFLIVRLFEFFFFIKFYLYLYIIHSINGHREGLVPPKSKFLFGMFYYYYLFLCYLLYFGLF